jgi:alpha-glucoside transport system permease protein
MTVQSGQATSTIDIDRVKPTAKTADAVPKTRRSVLARIAVHVTVVLICLAWIVPIVGALVSSFRTSAAASESGWWQVFTDGGLSLNAFRTAFASGQLSRSLLNSVLVALPSSLLLVAVAAVTAYVFATMQFRGRNVLFLAMCATLVLPHQLALEPLFILFTKLGLSGQYASLWMFQIGFALPLSILILRESFASIPKSLYEAAEMDGASPARTFLAIAVPAALPGMASVLILNVISSWNDLLAPLLFLGGRDATVTVQIAGLVNSADRDNTTAVAAAAIASIVIPMVIFLLLQRYFVRGFMSGAVKE